MHRLQGYFTPSWTALLCWVRPLFVIALWSHCLQGYFTCSWTSLLCWARLPFDVAIWSHFLYGYFTPSWTVFQHCSKGHWSKGHCSKDIVPRDIVPRNIVPRDFVRRKHCSKDNIVQRTTLFQGGKNMYLSYSLKLPYGHIAYKGTSPLYETIICTSKETISCTLSKNSYNFSLE